MTAVLKITHLSKKYGRNQVLDGFTMELEKGKIHGLIGKNGEGKTTLIRIIMGIIPKEKGEIYYKGRLIRFGDTSYKKEIGYIAEDSVFFDWMTVNQFLAFNAAFYPRWNQSQADAYLKRLSLSPGIRIKSMSRGMKLKLGLIAALASNPEILLLDDPTSGLDVPTRQDFLNHMIGEIKAKGTTILFATHMVHELENIIQRLSILHNGRLILDNDYKKIKKAQDKNRSIEEIFLNHVSE